MDAWPGGNLVTALSAFLDVSSRNLAVPQGAAIFARAAIELPRPGADMFRSLPTSALAAVLAS